MEFETERLFIRKIEETDRFDFYDLQENPKVMNPIPLPAMTRLECDKKLAEILKLNESKDVKKLRAIVLKETNKFIGLAMLMKNDEDDNELGYRLREKYWGKGYATEVTKGIIEYCFNVLNEEKITGDAFVENLKSLKILSKFMEPAGEVYFELLDCQNMRFQRYKKDYKF